MGPVPEAYEWRKLLTVEAKEVFNGEGGGVGAFCGAV